MTRTAAASIGFTAVFRWSFPALLSTPAGPIPPFQLAAVALLLGGLVGASRRAVRRDALRQPRPVWRPGTAGLCFYRCAYLFAVQSAPPVEASLIAHPWLLVTGAAFGLPGAGREAGRSWRAGRAVRPLKRPGGAPAGRGFP